MSTARTNTIIPRRSFRCLKRLTAAALLLALAIASPISAQTPGGLADSWDAAYLLGKKIGYVHTLADRVEAGGQAVIHMRQDMVLTVKRFDDVMQIRSRTDSYEFLDGRLYAIDHQVKMANQEQRTRGTLTNGNKFRLDTTTPGKTQSEMIDWSNDILGPYAHERLLKEKPIKPGETRTFKAFWPDINVVEVTLAATSKEKTQVAGGKEQELLRVEQTTDKLPLKMSLWLDDSGSVIKSEVPIAGLSMTTLRVTKAEALDESAPADVDLGYRTLVKADRKIPNAHEKTVTYRLELEDKRAADSIPQSSYQKVLAREGNTVRIRVSKTVPNPDSPADATSDEFLAPNGFIQSDDKRIVETAQKIVGRETKPWEEARLLEKWVEKNMSNADFTVGFATAGEVIQTRQGDCTEHAVLLAALCRAAGVPSRVAMGLVYIERPGVFGYHMWTEVRIGGEWYALDGTLGQGYIAGGHIKLADGSLKGASAMSTFLPIINIIGKLKITVEAVE